MLLLSVRAEATGDYALAIGGAAGGKKVSAAEYGTAVGVRANAANRGAAFGAGSNAEAQKSVAIGYTAKASAQKLLLTMNSLVLMVLQAQQAIIQKQLLLTRVLHLQLVL